VTVKSIAFNVSCPRCGAELRRVQMADPVGWVHRERRVVVECTAPHCRHCAVVEVHLVDVGARDTTAAARKRRQRTRAVA